MKDKPFVLDFKEEDKPFAFKELLMKYMRFWYWFVLSFIVFMALGYVYTKYSPVSYKTIAKIKILDDDMKVQVVPNEVALANRNKRLNLENHVEVLKSYRLLSDVVRELDLDVEYHEKKGVFYSQIWRAPFVVKKEISEDLISKPLVYEITLSSTAFNIKDKTGKYYILPFDKEDQSLNDNLPFSIELIDIAGIQDYKNKQYKIELKNAKQVSIALSEDLIINTSVAESNIIALGLKGQSNEHSEAILNEIISKFDADGISDRRFVSKRTLEIIDKRFLYLTQELDSIETGKQDFKRSQNLSNIQADTDASLQRKSNATTKVLQFETQLSLAEMLRNTVAKEIEYGLLPADIGLANSGLNTMVIRYNEMARERQKLVVSAGPGHPKLKSLSEQLQLGKLNILNTVNIFESQLKVSLKQLNQEKNAAGYTFSSLPKNERKLRAIERQQSIKENLYLLLLKKREEAAINYAATSPSIKVVDYGLTGIKPLWPKKIIVFPLCLILSILFPFIILYVLFSLDNKIYTRQEMEKVNPEVPVLIEIPFFSKTKRFIDANDRSVLAESFRILSTNVDYLLRSNDSHLGKVVFITSSVQEEGKTLVGLNLSLAYASMGKKVLLVGADLRNPQLHTYFEIDKKVMGLSDFLVNKSLSFDECLHEGFDQANSHKVYFSGTIPPNAPILLSSKRFEEFIEKAKQDFDYVIVDTAPTMLVTDTLLVSKYADVTLFVVRSGYTDKRVMKFSKGLSESNKLKNMAYVLNGVFSSKGSGYNYGYEYGYSSGKKSKPWYKKNKKNSDPLIKVKKKDSKG